MRKEAKLFQDYCNQKKLKMSERRNRVLATFLATEKHVSALELYNEMKNHGIGIGYSTVYRTLRLLAESGLAREVDLGSGETYFEHQLGHRHHDHLKCLRCGKTIEFFSPKIEKLQNHIAQKNNFHPQTHNLIIYGLCAKCH